MIKLERIILGLMVSVLPLQVFALDDDILKESFNSSPQMTIRKTQPRSMSEGIPHQTVRSASSRAATYPTVTDSCNCPPLFIFLPNASINIGAPRSFEDYLKTLSTPSAQENIKPLIGINNKPADPDSPKTVPYKTAKEAVLSNNPQKLSKALVHGKYGLKNNEYGKLLTQTNSPAIQQIINNAWKESNFDPVHYTN